MRKKLAEYFISTLTGVLVIVFASDTSAQDVPRGQTADKRQQEQYKPVGGRLGSFLFFPLLELAASYDSNIFATESGTVDDYIGTVSPQLTMRSDWNVHSLTTVIRGDVGRYESNSRENFEDFHFNTNGRLDVRRTLTVNGSAGYERLHEERGAPGVEVGRSPVRYERAAGGVGVVYKPNRLSLGLRGNVEAYDYSDAETGAGVKINHNDRNRQVYTVTGRAGYAFQKEYEAFISAAINSREYDQQFDDNGLNRESDGYQVNGGVRLDLGGVVQGNIFAGYMEQQFDDAALSDISGLSFGAGLTWNITRLTTARFNASRTVAETTIVGASGSLNTNVSVTLDHELRRNILLHFGAGYTESDFRGVSRTDDVLNADARVRYLLNRNFYVEASTKLSTRDSTVANSDYTRSVTMVKLGAQL